MIIVIIIVIIIEVVMIRRRRRRRRNLNNRNNIYNCSDICNCCNNNINIGNHRYCYLLARSCRGTGVTKLRLKAIAHALRSKLGTYERLSHPLESTAVSTNSFFALLCSERRSKVSSSSCVVVGEDSADWKRPKLRKTTLEKTQSHLPNFSDHVLSYTLTKRYVKFCSLFTNFHC